MANHHLLLLTLAVAPVFTPVSAHANVELVLQMESSLRYDSNPLRFTHNADVQPVVADKKSDSVLANDVRWSVVYPLGLPDTRLVFGGQVGRRNFDEMTWLNHSEYAYRTGLEWHWGQLWRGEVFHAQSQKLFDYLDGSLTTRDLVRRATDRFEVALRMTPDIELPLALKNERLTYDSLDNFFNENVERSIDLGVALRQRSGSRLRVGVRSADATFPNRTPTQTATLDNFFRDNEIYFQTDWKYSEKTRFSGRVASLRRGYGTLPALDFSATTVEFAVDHDYSPKTKFEVLVWNRPTGSTNPAILYAMTEGAQLALRWQATVKTRLSLKLARELERYQTTSAWSGPENPVSGRVRFGAGAVYAFSRDFSLYMDGFRDELNRGGLGPGISQNTVRAGLEYTFENQPGLAVRSGLGERRQLP